MTTRALPSPRACGAVAILALVLSVAGLAWAYLVHRASGEWQVDLQVYRGAADAMLHGTPLYDYRTPAPQDLPFTYPPFAALLAVPWAVLPRVPAAWLWTLTEAAAVCAITWYAGARLWRNCGAWRVAAWASYTAVMLWTWPVRDGFRFGQVDAFLALACLIDLVRPTRPAWLRRIPTGVLVGLATAVKLTPGVFIVHFLVTRQWRAAATAVGSAAAATLGTALVVPHASWTFWTSALFDSSRVGRNEYTANQSMRGVVLRWVGEGSLGTVVWLLLVVAVAVAGLAIARRAHLACNAPAEVAAVGVVGFLVSPVSWIHHMEWLLVVILVILGARPWRHRRRAALAGTLVVLYLLRLVWWGQWRMEIPGQRYPQHRRSNVVWELLNNSHCLMAVVLLAAIGWVVRRPRPTG